MNDRFLSMFFHACVCSYMFRHIQEWPTCPCDVNSIWEFRIPRLISGSDTGKTDRIRLQVTFKHWGLPLTGFTLFKIAGGNITEKDRVTRVRKMKKRNNKDRRGRSTTVSPSSLPGWHRGSDRTSWPWPCAVMVMQNTILTDVWLIFAVQVVWDVVQVNGIREQFVPHMLSYR